MDRYEMRLELLKMANGHVGKARQYEEYVYGLAEAESKAEPGSGAFVGIVHGDAGPKVWRFNEADFIGQSNPPEKKHD